MPAGPAPAPAPARVAVPTPGPRRRLRRDAERNLARILAAARELFADRGLRVTLNDVAHHAGVGVGTVYRRFSDKTALIDELFEERVRELLGLIEEANADPDPWHGLTRFLERALALQAGDHALRDLITGMPDGLERVARARAALLPASTELMTRAMAAGALRSDIGATDLPIIQLLLSGVIDASRDVEPELWRRYLSLVIRGMAADPDAIGPLAPEPLEPAQIDAVMSQLRTARRASAPSGMLTPDHRP